METKAWTFECAKCAKQASVTSGTIIHGSKLALHIWFWAAYLMAQFDLIDASKPLVLALSLLWLVKGIRRSVWQVIDDNGQFLGVRRGLEKNSSLVTTVISHFPP